jgi:hypothetical protein
VRVRPVHQLVHRVADDAAVDIGRLKELRIVAGIAVDLDAVARQLPLLFPALLQAQALASRCGMLWHAVGVVPWHGREQQNPGRCVALRIYTGRPGIALRGSRASHTREQHALRGSLV